MALDTQDTTLAAHMIAAAEEMYARSWDTDKGYGNNRHGNDLRDDATTMASFARQLQDDYAPLAAGSPVTNAQAIALGRKITDRTTVVRVFTKGAGGLPSDYLLALVESFDGTLEYGIAPDGAVSS